MSEVYRQQSLFADEPSPRTWKTCLGCGMSFRVKPSHYDKRVYCGRRCMGEGYRLRYAGSNNPNYRNATEKHCASCGKRFVAYGKARRFCSVSCGHHGAVRNHGQRVCLACEASFTARMPWQTYCTGPCRRRASRPRRPSRARAFRIGSRRACRCCHNLFTPSTSKRWCCDGCRERVCVVCQKTFIGAPSLAARTCSTPCARRYLMVRQQGARSHRWRGGKTSQAIIIRCSAGYKMWRAHVFERDDYRCQLCRERGGRLAAHHIKPFANHGHLALEPWNGITLCWPCHTTIRGREADYEERFFAISAILS